MINEEEIKSNFSEITEILSIIDNKDDIYNFLRDLLSPKEILEFSNRLQAAEMLAKKVTYSVIEKETGLSSTTVARVSKCLNGEMGGYRTIIGKLHHHSSLQTGKGSS